jgi:hypothetical protein
MFYVVSRNFRLAKNMIPLIRQKSFEENKERGNGPVTSPTEGGSTTITSKSPSEAVFIAE